MTEGHRQGVGREVRVEWQGNMEGYVTPPGPTGSVSGNQAIGPSGSDGAGLFAGPIGSDSGVPASGPLGSGGAGSFAGQGAATAAAPHNLATEFAILEQTLRDNIQRACRDLKAEMSAYCGSAVTQMVNATETTRTQLQMEMDRRLQAGMGPVGPGGDLEVAYAQMISTLEAMKATTQDIINGASTRFTEQENKINELYVSLTNKFQEVEAQKLQVDEKLRVHEAEITRRDAEANARIEATATAVNQLQQGGSGAVGSGAGMDGATLQRVQAIEMQMSALNAATHTGAGQGGSGGRKPLLPEKFMVPSTFTGTAAQWKDWSEDTMTMLDIRAPGLSEALKELTAAKDSSRGKAWVSGQQAHSHVADYAEDLWQVLKRYTSETSEARVSVISAQNQDGFEAWSRLAAHYGQTLAAAQGAVLSELSALSDKKMEDT